MSSAARAYALATIALLGAGAAMAAVYAPSDPKLGAAQQILYLHLPFALNTYLACGVAFVAGVGYLASRGLAWDRVGYASVRVAAMSSTIVLLTGMVLARSAWGHWWVWSPKLTFSLILWALLVAYLLTRVLLQAPSRRAMVGAVYAIVALLDVPLVYLSVKLLPDVHPESAALDGGAQRTLLVCMVAVTMACVGLIVAAGRGARAAPPPRSGPSGAAKPRTRADGLATSVPRV